MKTPVSDVPAVISSLAIFQQFNSTQMVFIDDLPCASTALDQKKQRSMSQSQPSVEKTDLKAFLGQSLRYYVGSMCQELGGQSNTVLLAFSLCKVHLQNSNTGLFKHSMPHD